jgi:hypothetical protein
MNVWGFMLTDYQTLLRSMVHDDSNVITTTDIDKAIQLAVVRYSSDFPLMKVTDLTANGLSMLSVPVDWVAGFSAIANIEYPLGGFPPNELDAEQYCLYQSSLFLNVLFVFIPTDTVRLTYTLPHTVSNTVDTIKLMHQEGVLCWAAAWCCDALASYYATANDSTIQADHVQRNSQSADYARLAKSYRSRYFSELGIKEDRKIGASAVVDLDLQNSRNQDRFIHSNRYR